MGKNRKIPSPCIDICKGIRGVCVGCGRTKKDEKAWKKAESDEERLELLRQCLKKTAGIGTQKLWLRQYQRKCLKKGVPWLVEELVSANAELTGR